MSTFSHIYEHCKTDAKYIMTFYIASASHHFGVNTAYQDFFTFRLEQRLYFYRHVPMGYTGLGHYMVQISDHMISNVTKGFN